MKKNNTIFRKLISVSLLVLLSSLMTAQNKKGKILLGWEKPQYRNLFKEAGYSQKDIDEKLNKA